MKSGLLSRSMDAHVRALILAGLALLMSVLAWGDYQSGDFERVLLIFIMVPPLLLTALWMLLQGYGRWQLVASIGCLMLLAMPSLMDVFFGWRLPQFSLMAVPFVAYLLLPERAGQWFCLTLGALIVIAPILSRSPVPLLLFVLDYSLLALILTGVVSLVRRKDSVMTGRSLKDRQSGAYTVGFLVDSVTREVARCSLTGSRVSLIGLSIDEYQQLNVSHTRRELNQLLQRVVSEIRGRIRSVDDVYRIEDDVWVVMLPDCREDAEIVLREALVRHLEEVDWQKIDRLSLTATGVTLMEDETGEVFIRRLFSRMNKQKQSYVQVATLNL